VWIEEGKYAINAKIVDNYCNFSYLSSFLLKIKYTIDAFFINKAIPLSDVPARGVWGSAQLPHI
jgi:hypothetical protein